MDGEFNDWQGIATHPLRGGPDTVPQLRGMAVANDDRFLYLRIDVDREANLQRRNSFALWLDFDPDSRTGSPEPELYYRFSERSGRRFQNGEAEPISHADLGISTMPTFSSKSFEMSIPLSALRDLAPGKTIGIGLTSAPAADRCSDYHLHCLSSLPYQPPAPSMEKRDPSHLRLLVYNVLLDGLFKRPEVFKRIFSAVGADVVLLLEVFDHSAGQVMEWWRTADITPVSAHWHAFGHPGKVTLSRFPFADTLVFDHNLCTRISLPGAPKGIWIISCHLACCDADSARQQQANEIMRRLTDAQQGRSMDWVIAKETPIVIAGDFNLVGDARQFQTLKYGCESGDEYSPPDWDGSELEDVRAFHLGARELYTWRDDDSSFSPGRLDFVFYTGSVLEPVNCYVLRTPELSGSLLRRKGLKRRDTQIASDHLPLVVDFVRLTDVSERVTSGKPGP